MNTINLLSLYKKEIVKKGSHNVNVPIKKVNGENYDGHTYMIPLEYLYYNDLNGRIGVALSEYESKNGKIEPGHNENYNIEVQKMLTNDDDGKTKKEMDRLVRDMHRKGQQEVGYVLLDGRVIDGNRRFTAKRILDQDSNVIENQYFEAVILDDLSIDNRHDLRLIKSLELQIQFGKLDKVDYDPIDRAIDAYKTIVKNNLMTVKEYSEYADLKVSEVNKRILEAELILKFLKFSNAERDNYSLAKQLDLDGPLQDLIPQYKKFKDSEQEEQLLNSLFTKIIQIRVTKDDFKNEFRNIVKNVVGTKEEEKFIESMEDSTDIIQDTLAESDKIKNNLDLLHIINENNLIAQSLSEVKVVTNRFSEQVNNSKDKNKPIILVGKAITNIENIDKSIISSLDEKSLDELQIKLRQLSNSISELIESV